MAGGAAFVVLHAHGMDEPDPPRACDRVSNPWGVPLFGGTFFGITGLHMTHVIIGVIYLGDHLPGGGARQVQGRRRRSERACTGTSSTWSGCSFSRWST